MAMANDLINGLTFGRGPKRRGRRGRRGRRKGEKAATIATTTTTTTTTKPTTTATQPSAPATTTTASTTTTTSTSAPVATTPVTAATATTAASTTEVVKIGDGDHPEGNGDHGDFADPLFYINATPVEGSPDTPGKVSPDKEFEMKFVNGKLDMPDGREVEFWTFEDQLRDTEEDVILPGSPIRVVEGDIVHVTVKPSKRQHTIHLHGVEADTHNDGVGHTSFEVTGSYTYQFRAGAPFRSLTDPRPKTRGAGTYIYHCHVNTTLHYQMGMWGPLIVDPIEGPGTAFHGGPTYDVAAERVWASGDVDPGWHDELGHAAGMDGEDVGLNIFEPKYFHMSGVFQPMKNGSTDPDAVIFDPRIATTAALDGEPILIRWVNAGYVRQIITFDGLTDGALDISVIASDGRPFDGLAPNFATAFPLTGPFEAMTAERYDFIITPKRKGTTIVTVENLDWITGRNLGVVRTAITIV